MLHSFFKSNISSDPTGETNQSEQQLFEVLNQYDEDHRWTQLPHHLQTASKGDKISKLLRKFAPLFSPLAEQSHMTAEQVCSLGVFSCPGTQHTRSCQTPHLVFLFKMSIPVVDFGACSLSEIEDFADERMHKLSKQLESAFTEVGFVFLENTGITQEEVNRVMAISKTFFLQPEEEKQPFSRKSFANNPNHGWVQMETERLNPRRPGDLKEAFNVTSILPDIKWPSGAVKGFQEMQTSFFRRCHELSLRVLRVMAVSLGLDPQLFLSTHRFIGTEGNGTTLRALYYPPVNHKKVKEGQLRCGEHSDYGSITLLFSSSEGLEVQSRSGEFIGVPYVPGAVLINVADLMQRWTSDHYVSVVHRVLLPPAGDSGTRQSLAFFVQPDDEALITCCDGSNKYPPVTGGGYLSQRFKASYGQN